ncbi:MAG: phenylalanine--tRNA ligase subunit beta [Thermoplasmata archaeon]
MVVVRIDKMRIRSLTGLDDISDIIEILGGDIKREDENSWDLEFYPDRPDLYSLPGLVLNIRQIMQGNPVMRSLKNGNIKLYVDQDVVNIRPYIGGAAIRGINIDDYVIREIMDMQEKYHSTIGRNRERIAIGIHDLDKVHPPFYYRAIRPDEIRFTPLGYDKEMDLNEILEKHEKGRSFSYILKDKSKYPVILDSDNNVLSFPPIINGRLTEVNENTKNIFIDVTGTDLFAVVNMINIISYAVPEYGGYVETVEIVHPKYDTIMPNFEREKMDLGLDYMSKILGDIDINDIENGLNKMGYLFSRTEKKFEVSIPPYRTDVMHQIDVVEDIAKIYGYNRISKRLPEVYSIGKENRVEYYKNKIRMIMVGLGFMEVTNLTLTSVGKNFNDFGLEPKNYAKIINPVTEEQSIVRTWLLPGLMEILQYNKRRPVPQKIFEVGEIYDSRETIDLAGAIISSNTSFTEIKGVVGTIMESMNVRWDVEESDFPFMIGGRQAWIMVDGERCGFFGEIHPEIIEKSGLGNPMTSFEMNIEKIFRDIFSERIEDV